MTKKLLQWIKRFLLLIIISGQKSKLKNRSTFNVDKTVKTFGGFANPNLKNVIFKTVFAQGNYYPSIYLYFHPETCLRTVALHPHLFPLSYSQNIYQVFM